MNSCFYEGTVRHRRFGPVRNDFEYRLFMVYLDFEELEEVFSASRLWSHRRRAIARFNRSDHLGPAEVPLDEHIRDLVQEKTGSRPDGPIRMLTHLRYFGLVFNPVSFYYCYDATGTRLETAVLEVHNTPWNEVHPYVLHHADPNARGNAPLYAFPKKFHVSPFMSLDMTYQVRLSVPGKHMLVHMENWQEGGRLFDATLTMQRREITNWGVARQLVRFPMMTTKVVAAIYWQALKLWWKGAPYVPHPKHHVPREDYS